MAIGAAVAAAAGLAQLGVGAYQMYKGNKMRPDRPEYKIPDEINANVSQAERMALQGLPEEQKQQYLDNLQRGMSFSMAQSGSRKAGLAGLSALNQQQNDAYGNMLSMDAQARQQNQQLAMQQRGILADYKDQAFQVNKLNPFYEQMAESQGLKGAGLQNIVGGVDMAATGLAPFLKDKKTVETPQQIKTKQAVGQPTEDANALKTPAMFTGQNPYSVQPRGLGNISKGWMPNM